MPRYYCDYCDAYLTHDSASVRKQHNSGFKHKSNFKAYYLQYEEEAQMRLYAEIHGLAGPGPGPPFAPVGGPPPSQHMQERGPPSRGPPPPHGHHHPPGYQQQSRMSGPPASGGMPARGYHARGDRDHRGPHHPQSRPY